MAKPPGSEGREPVPVTRQRTGGPTDLDVLHIRVDRHCVLHRPATSRENAILVSGGLDHFVVFGGEMTAVSVVVQMMCEEDLESR